MACWPADGCLARAGTSEAFFDGSGWTVLEPAGVAAVDFGDLFCQSAAACEAIGPTAEVFDGATWSEGTSTTTADPDGWAAASCPSTTFCAAVTDENDAVELDSSQPPATLTTSPVPVPPGGEPHAVSCPTTSWCLAVDSNGAYVTGAGQSWSIPATAEAGVSLSAVDPAGRRPRMRSADRL